MEREQLPFDVLFVGGGPAALTGAIRLMQLAKETDKELEVALIEKGAEIGSHAVSGAVLNPKALAELIPDYKTQGCPIEADVHGDALFYLTANSQRQLPWVPKQMHNSGFHVVSQSRLTRWLGDLAEEMGVNIFPGFTGKEILYDSTGQTIIGIRTGDKGLDHEGQPKGNFEPGYDLMAKVTIFAEGARGSLAKEILAKIPAAKGEMPQVYEIGIKEVIQLPENHFFTGRDFNDIHFMGYPLGLNTPGGGFIYEMADNRISIGFLTALCYDNPLMDPYEAFLKFKAHPFVADIIKEGKVVEQGARTVSSGGLFTIPKLALNGALFAGATAAMQNMPALKGIHLSMKSGMLAAETAFDAFLANDASESFLSAYPTAFVKSWAGDEMREGRNFSQALAKRGLAKFLHLGAQYFSGGKGLRDKMPHHPDFKTLSPLSDVHRQTWPEVETKELDNELMLDKLTGVYLSKVKHREDQPSHIIVHDTDICVNRCFENYGSPCVRFCPGEVYEIITDEATGKRSLKLNPSNCFHCKTCDIKDPYENITWTCPEGGEGPGYNVV